MNPTQVRRFYKDLFTSDEIICVRLTDTFAHPDTEFIVDDIRSSLNRFTCLPEARLWLSEEAAELNLNLKTQLIKWSPGFVFLSLLSNTFSHSGTQTTPSGGRRESVFHHQCFGEWRVIYYQVIKVLFTKQLLRFSGSKKSILTAGLNQRTLNGN